MHSKNAEVRHYREIYRTNLVRGVILTHLWDFSGFSNNQRSLQTWNTKAVKEQAASRQMGKFFDTHWTAKNRKGEKKDNQKEKCCKKLKAIHKHLLASCQQQLHFQVRMTLPYCCCKSSVQRCALTVPGWKGLQMKQSVTTIAVQNPSSYCDFEVSDLHQESD